MTATAGARRHRTVPAFWGEDSSPFSTADGGEPCRIVLRQVDDNEFALEEALALAPVADMPRRPDEPLVIRPEWLTSDLASIPSVLGWFARRHGRHTPAALVHDFLITGRHETPPVGLPADWVLPPEQADRLFRHMLLESGVPPVRSYLMWTAVVARTRWKTTARRRLGLIVWALAAAIGTGALVVSFAQHQWVGAVVALAAPVVASALWGGQWAAGVIAGYAVWWALIGAIPSWVAYKLYQGVEGLVWLARRRPGGGGAPVRDVPPPPVPFDQR